MTDIERTFRQGNLNEVASLLSNPALSGVYLSRARLRRLAEEMGLRAGVQGRARMIENLFREAGSEGRAEELIERLEAEAGRWLERYRLWAKSCPPARAAWKSWAERARSLRRHLRRARRWARRMSGESPGSAGGGP